MRTTFATIAVLAATAQGARTLTVTQTTFLPFDQQKCKNFYYLEKISNEQACQAGACCVGVETPTQPASKSLPINPVNTRSKLLEIIPYTSRGIKNITTTTKITKQETVITTTLTTDEVEKVTTDEPVTEVITTTIDGKVTTETLTTEEEVVTTFTSEEVETLTETESATTEITTETETIPLQDPETLTETAEIPLPPTQTDNDPTCPTPACEIGIEHARYQNPFNLDLSSDYGSFDTNYFKTKEPRKVDIVNEIYISATRDDEEFADAAAEYRAFLFACQDGTYKFVSPYSDDITIMWFGDKAYEGWTRENADIIQFYYGNNRPQTIEREIKAGVYYPIRVLWGNTDGAADLKLEIFAPDGRLLLKPDGTSYLTTSACDGSYPPYKPFGQEP